MINLNGFGLRNLKTISTALKNGIDENLDIHELHDHINEYIHKKEVLLTTGSNKKLSCEKCNSRVVIEKVNISRCTKTTNKKEKTAIMCTNSECLHTEYSVKSFRELVA